MIYPIVSELRESRRAELRELQVQEQERAERDAERAEIERVRRKPYRAICPIR